MERKNKAVFISFFILFSAFSLNAQQHSGKKAEILPVIALTGIVNNTGLEAIDKAAVLIEETLKRNLDLTGQYKVVSFAEDNLPEGAPGMMEFCKNTGSNYILSGKITKNSSDINIEIALFSVNSSGDILKITGTAQSPSKLRFAMEKILTDVLGYFTGKEVSFASVSLVNMGKEEGSYSVFIDSMHTGDNLEYIDYLLSGKRHLEILQNRMGKQKKLADIDLLIMPQDRVSVEFEIPSLSEKEKRMIGRYEKTVDNHAGDKYRSRKVDGAFKSLFTLLEDPSFCTEAVSRKKEIILKHEKWEKDMGQWGLERGLTSADLPYSFGVKAMLLTSAYDIRDWDEAGARPEGGSGASWGGGFFGSADLNRFTGIQGELLVYNQKTSADYAAGYPLAGPSGIEMSAWFVEFPLLVYFRVPSYLLKFYAGASFRYRLTEMDVDITDTASGESSAAEYDEKLLRMQNSAWLAGIAFEMPVSSNLFFLDFRYNRDLFSWFESWAPEEDFFSSYISCSIGYTFKAGK